MMNIKQAVCKTLLLHRGPKIVVIDKADLRGYNYDPLTPLGTLMFDVTLSHRACKRCGMTVPAAQPSLRYKQNGRLRRFVYAHVYYRAGWPDRNNPPYEFQRYGKGWLRVGPFVFGNINVWSRSNAA